MMKETLGGHLRAEFIRLKRSATLWFSLIGLLIGVLSILLSGGTRAAGFESAVFSWQVMYFTGMAAPLMMVLAAIQESRDKNARMAGLAWRGANPRYAQLARLCGAGIAALCFQALSYGSIILIAAAPVGGGLIGFFYCGSGPWGISRLGRWWRGTWELLVPCLPALPGKFWVEFSPSPTCGGWCQRPGPSGSCWSPPG